MNTSYQDFLDKYMKVLSTKQFCMVEDVILGIKQNVCFSDQEIAELDRKLAETNELNRKLSQSASRNNEGITLEKAGDIEEAIKVYEENIADGYPATHSYERLMILYHKEKMYSQELRVIIRAIAVFTEVKNSDLTRWNKRFEKVNKILSDAAN